jgi:hypothetical protein
VTLSDEEARRRGTQKSILERKAPPTFTVMVEIQERDRVAIVLDVAAAVDALLRGQSLRPEIRERAADGSVTITEARAPAAGNERRERMDVSHRALRRHDAESQRSVPGPEDFDGMPQRNPLTRGRGTETRPVRIFPFGVSRNRLEQAIAMIGVPATIVRDVPEADMVLTLKNYYRQRPQPLRDAELRGISIFVLRSNTVVQMVNVLRDLVREARPDATSEAMNAPSVESGDLDDVTSAMFEAEDAINAVMSGAPPVGLRPAAPYIRRLQHQLAERYNLGSRSRGREPNRHVEIYREAAVE